MRRLVGSLVLLALLAVGGYAQTFRGAINGTVSDPSGAMVAGATVKATNVATGVTLTTTTTTDGQFVFQDLPLGSYKIVVNAAGFSTLTTENVAVTAGQAYTLAAKLKVGETSTSVEVSAAALSLDTTTATQDNTLPTQSVQDLPMNGRDFTQFIAVQPGYSGYAVGGFGSLNGTRANQMNWQIDGVDNNDFWHNIPAVNQGGVSGIAGVVMPLDAVDEFATQTASAAEGGRNAGGIVNVVLKSGTNQLHGSVYYYNRNTALGAATPFFNPAYLQSVGEPTSKPPLRNENYGLSLGGPIIKDRTFWFITYERQKYTIGLSGLNTEPSQAYFTKAGQLLAGAGIPQSTISQQMEANFWPPYIANLPAQPSNYFATNPSTGYSYNGVIKLDHNFNTNHHLSARWFGGQGSQTAPLGGSAALATASSNLTYYFEKAPIHVYNYAITLNSVLTPKVTNQVLFGVNYFNQTFNDANHSFDTRSYGLYLSPDALIKGKPILGAPNIIISGFEQVGITPPEGRNDITGMLTDIVSYTVGKHQFRFGGEFRQGRVDEFYYRHALGKFTFDGSQGPGAGGWAAYCGIDPATAPAGCTNAQGNIDSSIFALADFLAGNVAKSSISVGNAEREVLVNGFNFFGQDAWQVSQRLTLNLGLRWDYFGPLHNGKKDLAVFVPGKGLVIQGNGIDSIFPPDRKAIGPRLGFAYQPGVSKDTVLRGSFGIHYDQINMNPFLDFRPPNNANGLEDNPAGPKPVAAYTANTLGQTSYTWQPNVQIFPGVQTCLTGQASECGSNLFDVYAVNQHFRTPYFFEYSLNVQKGLGNVAVWQVGYVGTQGRRLSIMQNIGPLSAYPNFNNINQLSSIGTSSYSALQTTLRLRSWHGVNSQIAYTWGHTIDQITEYRGALADSATNLSIDRGNGDFDTRHNFSGVVTWDIPGSSRGPKWLSHGWSLNSLMTFHSGQPTDETLLGLSRIADPFAGVSHSFQKSVTGFTGVQWWNPSAFCVPGTYSNGTCPGGPYLGGNLSRNQYAGPSFREFDLSVIKNISITERFRAQFRVEMFNLFNNKNFASGVGAVGTNCSPDSTTGKCTSTNGFGQVTDTIGDFNGAPGLGPGEAFNTQLALKIIF